jgi:hypothetical protein
MYWMFEPSKLVRKSSDRGAARSRRAWRSGGQRPMTDQRAKWMKESLRSGLVTSRLALKTSISFQLKCVQSAHH